MIRVALVQNYDLRGCDRSRRHKRARTWGLRDPISFRSSGWALRCQLRALAPGAIHGPERFEPPTHVRRSLPQSVYIRDRHLGTAPPRHRIGAGAIAGKRVEPQRGEQDVDQRRGDRLFQPSRARHAARDLKEYAWHARAVATASQDTIGWWSRNSVGRYARASSVFTPQPK